MPRLFTPEETTLGSTTLPESLVSPEWLTDHLDNENVRVVDIRGSVTTDDLGNGRQAAHYASSRDAYDANHIPGAVFVDWTKDITDPDDDVKVQIAPPELFKQRMEAIGIGDDSLVVVVDDTGGHLATRLWWALNYYGHDEVAVLDGGFARWTDLDLPVTEDAPSIPTVTFTPKLCPWLRADVDDVQKRRADDSSQIVDARDEPTYAGNLQRGPRGGHIPGAFNLPAKSLVRQDGRWRTRDEICAEVSDAGVALDQPVTAYCNGGVTATALLFGLHRAGLPLTLASNYDGSWNEWGDREDLPVENNQDLFGERDRG